MTPLAPVPRDCRPGGARLSLDHAYSAGLYHAHPDAYTLLVMTIAREISRRLRHADAILADLSHAAEETWRRLHTPAHE